MNSLLLSIEEATKKINTGANLLLAAEENILKKLPHGNWIAGTIPYFMSQNGGEVSQDKVFVTELPSFVKFHSIELLDENNVSSVYEKIPNGGFGIIIIPALTPIHLNFAMGAPTYKDFAVKPLVGWISGIHLNDLGKITPKVMHGKTGKISESEAIVMNFELPEGYVCDLGILNIFKQGNNDTLEFPETGFTVKDVLVNGQKRNFVDYLLENKVDVKNPLVADYAGAMINVSFQAVDEKTKTVSLYAPVFKGTQYKLADSIPNYVKQFTENMPTGENEIAFSCNCILNFLYSELEGKKTGSITGPITFGEVAYQLLNQTMVYLKIIKI